MKNFLLSILFILVFGIGAGIFAQNSTDLTAVDSVESCCCVPETAIVSGRIYSDNAGLLNRNVTAVAVYNISPEGNLISYSLNPVGMFGYFRVSSTTCTYTVIQPVLTAYGQKVYPTTMYALYSDPIQYFGQLDGDRYMEFYLSLVIY